MRKLIIGSVLTLAMFQMGCSALKCGCGGDEPAAKKTEAAATEKKGCGCHGCAGKADGGETCGMAK